MQNRLMHPVSVCVPTFNGERYISDALFSILAQKGADFKLIVSDDASDDGTQAAIQNLVDPRLRLVSHPQRAGLVGNWNRCIELASGEYIYIFHQDDLMRPGNLECKTRLLDEHPEVGFVFSNMEMIDESGAIIGGHWSDDLPDTSRMYSGLDLFRLLLESGNVVPCQAVMVRAECFQAWGGFDARLHYTPDLEMWLRLCLHYRAAYLAEPLVAVRRHRAQESSRFLGSDREVFEVWRAVEIIFSEQRDFIPNAPEHFHLALTHLLQWDRWLLRLAISKRQFGLASRHLLMLARLWRIRRQGLPEPVHRQSG